MLNLEAKTINHQRQRYETVGDYFMRGLCICFRVSDMGRWEYEIAVLVHEIIEWALVKKHGIKIKAIDDFDKNYETEREMGQHGPDDEPGDDPESPYFREHCFATSVERMLIAAMDVSWKEYDAAVMGLYKVQGKK
jgi:hypothetical protein